MSFIKRNYGWVIVSILAIVPLLIIVDLLHIDFSKGLTFTLVKESESDSAHNLEMLYHITGEFAIRWMTAVLTCTPFFILFGITNLYVRQAMGIATGVWSFLHFIFFIWAEGFLKTFTQVNYVSGLIAVLLLIPLLYTSNRKSMKRLKSKWKKLQSLSYVAIFLSILHVAILNKTWLVYAIIVGLGFLIRIPFVKTKIIRLRST